MTWEYVKEHPVISLIYLAVIVALVIIIFSLAIAFVSKKSEHYYGAQVTKTPWKDRSEHLFSGELTPTEQAMYNKLSAEDPQNSLLAMRKTEYMYNKAEAPALMSALYS
jgi:hypothetical protein